MENLRTLLDLPLEVLDLIFQELSPSHKLRLADCHQILAEAFVYHAGDQFKKVILRELPEDDWSLILRFCGSKVLEIDFGYQYKVENNSLILKSIQKHCMKLQHIQIEVNKLNVNAVCSLLLKSEDLKSVDLSFGNKLDECDPEYTIHVLHQLPNLRKLKIVIPRPKVYLIQQLVDLEELDLTGSYSNNDFKISNIFEICAPLKKLRSLQLNYVFVTEPYQNCGLSFQFVEKLILHSPYSQHEPPVFPMLRYFDIWDKNNKRAPDYAIWLSKHGSTLEKAILNVDYFFDRCMVNLIRSCRKLKYLYVDTKCSFIISKASMSLFIELLKENGFTSDNPFELTVIGNSSYLEDNQLFEEEPVSELLRCTIEVH